MRQLFNLLLALASSAAAANAHGEELEWQAQWIGAGASSNGPNQWLAFRKSFDVNAVPEPARTRIAVDSKYWLWVNGRQVVFEGGLKRGPTPADTYFDEIDLSARLRRGRNTVAVLVWYFGKDGFSHKSSGRAGFIFQADLGDRTVVSDRSWKAVVHPAFGRTDEPHPNFRLPESNIRFDARQDLPGWEQPGFDDRAWPAARELGQPPAGPWNRLVRRPIPMWRNYGLRSYVNADDLPRTSDGSAIVARLPYNAQVSPYLEVESEAGHTIDIRTDHYLGGGPPNVRAEYITRDGRQAYENPGWMNGHAVHYTIPAGARILALKYRETGYDTEIAGRFECDDPFLNRLWQKAARTLYVTMRDTYLDCPDRERAQWWGDVVHELGEAFYALDTRSAGLARKGILELIAWQRDDGTIYSPIPAGNWDKELPLQMLNSVGYYGFWTYCRYSGDVTTIRIVYPGLRRYLEQWVPGADGLVVPRRGGWTWGDWGSNKDMTVLYNTWYYLALRGQLEMAGLLQLSEDAAVVRKKMKGIEGGFNRTYWNGEAYRSPGYEGETDDRAQALAVVAGLAQPDQFDAIRAVLTEEYHCSPYMEKYVLEALYLMRFGADAVTRMKKRYAEAVEHPSTTLGEHWSPDDARGTKNHGWSGGPLTLLSQYAAGIAPTGLGYETYHVMPQMGPLEEIRATVPSAKGEIALELQRTNKVLTLDLTSPAGTTATIGIPKALGSIAAVSVNGVVVHETGLQTGALKGLDHQGEEDHYTLFRVAPGGWSFRAEFQ